MQIIYNSLTEEKGVSNEYTCNNCNSIIKVSNGEMFTGYLGDKYFKCPVCGKYTMALLSEYQKVEDVVYPFSFCNYVKSCIPIQCTDVTVNELIRDVFKDDFDEVKMNMVEYGDTMVLAIDDGLDDEEPLYHLYVCKSVDITICVKK